MEARLHVGMLVPPYYELPPRGYGGIEATVATLIDALSELGHRVTLISAGGNGTRAEHVQTFEAPQFERLGQMIPEVVHVAVAERVLRDLDIDLVHDHTLGGMLAARARTMPTLATVHSSLQGELQRLYADLGDSVSLVAISNSQKAQAPRLNWCATVHNAVDPRAFTFRSDKDDFVLFLGRMAPDKGVPIAIEATRAAGRKLVMAAKCSEPAEKAYFESAIRPLLAECDVEYVGEVSGERKLELLSAASALVLPVCWEEPFGMVMIEAMSSGTPVVALARGAVPEVVAHGVTGYVCERPDQLPEALNEVDRLDPHACRRRVEEHFSPLVMARGYERAYVKTCRPESVVLPRETEPLMLRPWAVPPGRSAVTPQELRPSG